MAVKFMFIFSFMWLRWNVYSNECPGHSGCCGCFLNHFSQTLQLFLCHLFHISVHHMKRNMCFGGFSWSDPFLLHLFIYSPFIICELDILVFVVAALKHSRNSK